MKDLNDKNNYKLLSFWLGIICSVLIVCQIVLNTLGLQLELKVIIEVVSYILAILVALGVVKGNINSTKIEDIKKEIESNITSEININKKDSSSEDVEDKNNADI